MQELSFWNYVVYVVKNVQSSSGKSVTHVS